MSWYFECYTCEREFPEGWMARDNHCRATGHRAPPFECETCPRWFRSRRDCTQHMSDKNHFYYVCSICNETWPTPEACKNHEIADHFYCAECQRHFRNLNNIRTHMHSRIHLGQNMPCPLCFETYTTATGVVNHLESGTCPQAYNLNRDEVYRFVRSRDPEGWITKKLIGWSGSPSYEADGRSWNGVAYECYICHREFSTLRGLNSHFNSPVHQQTLYHCPQRSCRVEFKTLAGFVNHLESESCGFMRFQTVQNNVGELIKNGRLLTT